MRLNYPFTVETNRIFDVTEPSEYVALNENNKRAYDVIMSLGKVDLNEGSLAHTLLWNMFNENSVTGARLRDGANGLIFVEPPPEEE